MDAASLLLPILLIAVFYFLLIRPQQRQRRQMAELQQSVQPGSKVMTTAGLIATVVSIEDDEVVLEVAPGVHSRYVRRAIVNVIPSEEPTTSTTATSAAAEDEAPRHEPVLPGEDRTNGDDNR
ncbi:preprotein translocase subunit YajC [Jiangella asiatica]|uniref:Preprotein translocase subunit YajC n=1 Tax=Jiangella asiatica TaxID=2530372 RepID=A0A4R5DAT4_9ACTN|nr:preprotein translocase subunit YajC [Jiangella asiatica]TDE08584.1 preprotein translocase subunit YajC [Jiangella asiatica]